ncbi:beta-lactamase/transpeptidase-like protein [Xylogone sp. PMI_703]|nr:beta-lactamase/transpeptidase-like protein [Xylogone sp. PMI_703]
MGFFCLPFRDRSIRSRSRRPVAIEDALRQRIPVMEKILDITGQPGVSIGVIHEGRVAFKHNIGVLDVTTRQKTNSDTLYCVASLTKAFIAASLDLLVQEQKIAWDTPISSIIPEFNHVENASLFSNMTLKDIASHHTGLLSLDEITQGLDGRILIPKKDVVQVCNALPVKYDLRTNFLYNNALYALAGSVIERVSDYPNWGDFLHKRIFEPLKMTRSTAFRAVHRTDENIAVPYMILTDRTPFKIAPTELSADSMNGGSGGVRSSVNDLLKWALCLLRSFHGTTGKEYLVRQDSPIFNRTTIANPHSAEDGDYCMGWCYHRTPAKLGLISPNRTLESPVLGLNSPSFLFYGHQGDVPGYTCNFYIIPGIDSAIVVLSNGTGLSDATDWIAQDLLQTICKLQQPVDFVKEASAAANNYLLHYLNDFQKPLKRNQIRGTQPPPLSDFTGSYVMKNLELVCLDITADTKDSTKLSMTVNKQADQVWQMWYYHYDVWCHLPQSYDDCLARGLDRTQWSSFLISFTRDSTGKVDGILWKLDGVDVRFLRV